MYFPKYQNLLFCEHSISTWIINSHRLFTDQKNQFGREEKNQGRIDWLHGKTSIHFRLLVKYIKCIRKSFEIQNLVLSNYGSLLIFSFHCRYWRTEIKTSQLVWDFWFLEKHSWGNIWPVIKLNCQYIEAIYKMYIKCSITFLGYCFYKQFL